MLPEYAREFEQGGVARRIVTDADIPTVVVAMHEHELLGVLPARNSDHWHLLGEPAFFHLGLDGNLLAFRRHLDEQCAVGIVDCDDRNIRLAWKIIEIGRAPYRSANTPMNVNAGIDCDDTDRALALELKHLARKRKAFRHNDLAAQPFCRGQLIVLILVE